MIYIIHESLKHHRGGVAVSFSFWMEGTAGPADHNINKKSSASAILTATAVI